METLELWIKEAVNQGQWKAVKTSKSGPIFLIYIDDLLSLGNQRINVHKSKLFLSRNTQATLGEALSRTFETPLTEDLGVYLGMPIVHGRKSHNLYKFIIAKVNGRLSGWKRKILSKEARTILIQSVTSTISHYVIQTSRLPKSITRPHLLNPHFMVGQA
ncbi:hypothetical protein M9H77_27387 [Catharanthus roseus]|uniref:Uncharacterized protein n=1 Tax=Catharanthus roseus TaxID=4058 RepID=A0ACC0AD89_CATRO|nr:hypothetical protein M9H77_27387 [Catharanthus roseus]